LDAPRGQIRICPPLYIERHLESDDFGLYRALDEAFYFRPFLINLTPSLLKIQRCRHSRSRVLARRPYQAFATRKYLAWTTPGHLHVRFLAPDRPKPLSYVIPRRRLAWLDGTPGTLIVHTPHVVRLIDFRRRF
jgi:hypothetical protein